MRQTKDLSVIFLPGHGQTKSLVVKWGAIYAAVATLSTIICLASNFVFITYPKKASELSLLSSAGTDRLSYLLGQQIAYIQAEEKVYAESSELLSKASIELEKKDKSIRGLVEIIPQYKTFKSTESKFIFKEQAKEEGLSEEGATVSAKAAAIISNMNEVVDEMSQTESKANLLKWARDHSPNAYPVEGGETRSHDPPFGWRIHPMWGSWDFHTGIDIEATMGEPIYAVADGEVTRAAWYGGYGKCIDILHQKGTKDKSKTASYAAEIISRYAHCDELKVEIGQQVKRGDLIGYVGSTGNSTGPHVHFEIVVDNHAVDPEEYIRDVLAYRAHKDNKGEQNGKK